MLFKAPICSKKCFALAVFIKVISAFWAYALVSAIGMTYQEDYCGGIRDRSPPATKMWLIKHFRVGMDNTTREVNCGFELRRGGS